MNKMRIMLALMAGLVGSASATLVVDYQFNDADTTTLTDSTNAGTDGAATFSANLVGVAQNGNSLVFGGTTNVVQAKSGVTLASSVSTGVVTIQYSMLGADYSLFTKNNGFNVNFLDGTLSESISLRNVSNADPDMKFRDGDAGAQQVETLGGLTSMEIRIVMDLDANTVESFSSIDGAAFASVNATKYPFTSAAYSSFGGFELETAFAATWLATDTVRLDYLTVDHTVVPEPATLGLVISMGAGLLFVRRRFML